MNQIRLLLWLRWKLTLAALRTRGQRALAAVVIVFFGLPIALGGALFVGFLLFMFRSRQEYAVMIELVRYVFVMIYIMWITLPMLGFSQNESYDLTRALLYPVSARRLTAAAFLGGFLDPWALLALPTLIVIIVAFSGTGHGAVIAAGAVALFMFHTIGLSQTINVAILGFLQSRRFKDIATVLIPALVLGFYLLQNAGMRDVITVDAKQFLRGGHSRYLSFLPTNLFTMALGEANARPLVAVGWLLGGLIAAGATVWLGAWMIERLHDGSLDTSAPAARKRAARHERRAPSRLWRRLPADLAAMLRKDLRYFWRHPIVKSQLVGVLYMLGIWGLSAWRMRGGDADMPSIAPALMSFAMLMGIFLMEAQIAFNMFGIDGGAVSYLFLFPASRRRIMLAKALYTSLIMLCINSALIPIACAIMRTYRLCLPMLAYVVLASLVYAGAGCLMSIYFPMQVAAWFGRRMASRRAQMGCAKSAIYLLASLVGIVATVPVAIAALLPQILGHPLWLMLTIPLGAAYAVAIFWVCVGQGGELLAQREVEIADAVSPHAAA